MGSQTMATDTNNDYNLHEDDMKEKEKSDLKSKMFAELKGELLSEMNSKNKALLEEIDKLKNEIRDLNDQKEAASSNKRRHSLFQKIKKRKKSQKSTMYTMNGPNLKSKIVRLYEAN